MKCAKQSMRFLHLFQVPHDNYSLSIIELLQSNFGLQEDLIRES